MCEQKGAQLVSIQTVEKKDMMVSLVSSLSKRRRRVQFILVVVNLQVLRVLQYKTDTAGNK